MPRPAKSTDALKGHKTKEEIAKRQDAEKALVTGSPIKERRSVKECKTAHEEFRRVKGLMKAIQKDDAIYSAVINRYCELFAECIQLSAQKEALNRALEQSQDAFDRIADELDEGAAIDEISKFVKLVSSLAAQILKYDAQIMTKRKMMFDIEKENSMTVAAGLRTLPKEPPKKEENPLVKLLSES